MLEKSGNHEPQLHRVYAVIVVLAIVVVLVVLVVVAVEVVLAGNF